ncbi:hypothetical protein KKH27_11855 [bacterium]|nr:hypothetical protein [bacterium]MBU1983702.1 hypothetical protein [bacterium]
MKSRIVLTLLCIALLSLKAFALDSAERAALWTKTWVAVRDHFVGFETTTRRTMDRRQWARDFDPILRGLLNAPTDVEFWRILRMKLAELGDGQTTIEFPDDLPQEYDTVPIRILVAEEKVLVCELSGSPEVRSSGVQIGDELIAVDEIPVWEWIETECFPHVSASALPAKRAQAAQRVFTGKAGTKASFRFRRPNGDEYEVIFVRDSGLRNTYYHELFARSGLDSRLMGGGILYLDFHHALTAAAAEDAVRLLDENSEASAVILDLRDVSGGELPRELLARLALFPLPLGPYCEIVQPSQRDTTHNGVWYLRHKEDVPEEMLAPRPPVFRGKVMVLVNALTSGVAEQFLQPLVWAKRAVLIGEPTAGAGGITHRIEFGKGACAVITVREPYWENGYGNGKGFPVDVVSVPTAAGLAEGRDEVLEAAFANLRTTSK